MRPNSTLMQNQRVHCWWIFEANEKVVVVPSSHLSRRLNNIHYRISDIHPSLFIHTINMRTTSIKTNQRYYSTIADLKPNFLLFCNFFLAKTTKRLLFKVEVNHFFFFNFIFIFFYPFPRNVSKESAGRNQKKTLKSAIWVQFNFFFNKEEMPAHLFQRSFISVCFIEAQNLTELKSKK